MPPANTVVQTLAQDREAPPQLMNCDCVWLTATCGESGSLRQEGSFTSLSLGQTAKNTWKPWRGQHGTAFYQTTDKWGTVLVL